MLRLLHGVQLPPERPVLAVVLRGVQVARHTPGLYNIYIYNIYLVYMNNEQLRRVLGLRRNPAVSVEDLIYTVMWIRIYLGPWIQRWKMKGKVEFNQIFFLSFFRRKIYVLSLTLKK